MDELASLACNNFRNFFVAVPKPRHRNARQQVHVFLAVRIPQARTFGTNHRQRITAVGTTQKLLFPFTEAFQRRAHGNAPYLKAV